MSKPPNHEFRYPSVREHGYIPPHAYGVPEHDDFIDGLTLNELGGFCIIAYAKALAKETEASPITNVIRLDDYRHNQPWEAA